MRHNELDFGDCSPNDTVYRTFTMTHCNEAESTSLRFAWPKNHPNLQFKPAEGHLHPGRPKRITVMFKPGGVPVTLQLACLKCVLHRIRVPVVEGCNQVGLFLVRPYCTALLYKTTSDRILWLNHGSTDSNVK